MKIPTLLALTALTISAYAAIDPAGDPQVLAAWTHAETQVADTAALLKFYQSIDGQSSLPYFNETDSATNQWNHRYSGRNWIRGFFPGMLWRMYEHTGDTAFRDDAIAWTDQNAFYQNNTEDHDMGFIFLPGHGLGQDLAAVVGYPSVIQNAALGFNAHWLPNVGVLWSFNFNGSGGRFRARENIIIDSAMNIELMYRAAKNGGLRELYDRGLSHHTRLATDLIRPDGSSWQTIDYDVDTGEIRDRYVWQGFSVDSTWARGHGWGMHGLATGFRETGDPYLLARWQMMAEYYLTATPEDCIPYWDFDGPFASQDALAIRYNKAPLPIDPFHRDTSGAVLAAGAFLEMARLDPDNRERWFNAGQKILQSLVGPDYFTTGTNYASILRAGVNTYGGSPDSVDRGTPYGDYYFLDALDRYTELVQPRLEFSSDPSTGTRTNYTERDPLLWRVEHIDGDPAYCLIPSKRPVGTPPGEITVFYKDYGIGPFGPGYSISFSFKIDEDLEVRPDADVLIVFGHQSSTDYAYVKLSQTPGESGIYRVDGSSLTQVETFAQPATFSEGTWHQVSLSRNNSGTQIEVVLDGATLFTSTESSPIGLFGRVGFGSLDDAVCFDDVSTNGQVLAQLIPSHLALWTEDTFPDAADSILANPALDIDGEGRATVIEALEGTNPLVIDAAEVSLLSVEYDVATNEIVWVVSIAQSLRSLNDSNPGYRLDLQIGANPGVVDSTHAIDITEPPTSISEGKARYEYRTPAGDRQFGQVLVTILRP